MVFNSVEFLIFLAVVFCLFWLIAVKSLKLQNFFIVAASYFFYGWWDWRFLSLIFFSTVVDYCVGRSLATEENAGKRKVLLLVSIVVNLGFLGFFKYFNFFADNLTLLLTSIGFKVNPLSLNILLPAGISFYTFQTMSYTIDVYRRQLEPTKDFVAFSAFVSFFPQLVAGPIERATHLLPQFYHIKKFDYSMAIDGTRQIIWGMYKKVVIADNCGVLANDIFNNYSLYSGSSLLLGAVYFSFQIYCDFSGYSDIAIGTAKLFGFDIMQNFAYPYFSRDIAEFWRRWHISLSTWFRDYVYIPLGGSRCSTVKKIRNTFVVFLVSGFWHGANWTFIVWGLLHAVFFLPLLVFGKNRTYLNTVSEKRVIPTGLEFLQMFGTFLMVTLAWVFFRADNLGMAVDYLSGIFDASLFSSTNHATKAMSKSTCLNLIFFIVMEWFGRKDKYAIEKTGLNWYRFFRWLFYTYLIFSMLMFMEEGRTPFIYFQF